MIERVQALNRDEASTASWCSCRCRRACDANAVAAAIDPAKDVDGLHPLNAGRLLLGEPSLVPCTPLGILKILRALSRSRSRARTPS